MRLLFLLVPLSLFCESLRDRFAIAEPGDFIVTEQNKTYSLLSVREKGDETIILEEVSIPSHNAKNISWRSWFEDGAKGHTSWVSYDCDITTGEIVSAYSYTKEAHLALDTSDSFLQTLYSLNLKPIPKARQKKIGPAPSLDEPDNRKVWLPPKVVNNKREKVARFEVLSANWPKDGTQISGKRIELYFDPAFPFPYWLHVTDDTHTFKIRALDSGKNLVSPKKTAPKLPPEFIGTIAPLGDKLRFTLKGPYSSYSLLAVDISSPHSDSFSLNPIVTKEGNYTFLDIQAKLLNDNCIRGHTYLFYAMPMQQPELLIESPQTYLHN